ncbi:MAG: sugar transferase [Candidatus Eisenbacteria bacterium]|uniref:Sugar transferase n=1 Tax=Eiseniibacteriota bacterium TaxID=2212470 RepID=A0A538TLJ6_UNCEI|nr:MAG: sugar transferase [Candidatus Eisenbacteria bacterium]
MSISSRTVRWRRWSGDGHLVCDPRGAGARGVSTARPSRGSLCASATLRDLRYPRPARFGTGKPILYRWRVVGLRGRYFTGYKFRTMERDAEARRHGLESLNEMAGPVFKMRDDPRVTGIGRLLRRFSLDELPQLWSVLKGDMSLVGPRPPLRTEWENFEPWQRRKLAVKPGITCLWQVSGRSDIRDFSEWVRLDIEYIERWTTWLDLKILLATGAAVVRSKGAY